MTLYKIQSFADSLITLKGGPKSDATKAIPFNKDEITQILKFGAEELFKEDENDGAEPGELRTVDKHTYYIQIRTIDQLLSLRVFPVEVYYLSANAISGSRNAFIHIPRWESKFLMKKV